MKKLIEWMIKRWLPGYILYSGTEKRIAKIDTIEDVKWYVARYFHDYHVSKNPARKAKEGKE
jgi:hypothetical protein